MSSETTSDEHENAQQPSVVGTALKQARKDKGLELEDVSRLINIGRHHLEALESAEYERLPGLPFARGYLRSYARILGLNADELVDALNRETGHVNREVQLNSISRVQPQVKLGDPIIRWSLWIFGALFIGASIWWWQTQYSIELDDRSTDSVAPEIKVETATGTTETTSLTDRSISEEADPVSTKESPASAMAETDQDLAEPEPEFNYPEEQAMPLGDDGTALLAEDTANPDASETTAKPPASDQDYAPPQGTLAFSFVNECWVKITDGQGKVRVARVYQAGESMDLQVDLPVAIVIGNTLAVGEASFQGETLDLSPHSRGNVARFSLE